MPHLLIDHQGVHSAGLLNGRVLVGRWTGNTIVIPDRTVSRIHAWIGRENGHYYISDAASRTGTFVNGAPLADRHALENGDQIRVGSVILIYWDDSDLPPDVQEVDLSPRPAHELSGDHGMFVECACGAPVWIPENLSRPGRCRYCGHEIRPASSHLPKANSVAPAQAAREEKACGICQSPIARGEETTDCPACGLPFHSDCWVENRGCSAYGCSQVGVLESTSH